MGWETILLIIVCGWWFALIFILTGVVIGELHAEKRQRNTSSYDYNIMGDR